MKTLNMALVCVLGAAAVGSVFWLPDNSAKPPKPPSCEDLYVNIARDKFRIGMAATDAIRQVYSKDADWQVKQYDALNCPAGH